MGRHHREWMDASKANELQLKKAAAHWLDVK
jgi:hypothetical protein